MKRSREAVLGLEREFVELRCLGQQGLAFEAELHAQ
jgi:hypothetical protein